MTFALTGPDIVTGQLFTGHEKADGSLRETTVTVKQTGKIIRIADDNYKIHSKIHSKMQIKWLTYAFGSAIVKDGCRRQQVLYMSVSTPTPAEES